MRTTALLTVWALWGAAHVALYGGDVESLARYASQALEMAEALGDEWAMARALNANGVLQRHLASQSLACKGPNRGRSRLVCV
jgi:hypothetical protein